VNPDRDENIPRSVGTIRVVAIYAVFAALWILFSDQFVGTFVTDHDELVRASMIKGWAFVTVTALLLFGLVSRLVRRIDDAHEREIQSEKQKQEAIVLLMAINNSSSDAIFAKDAEGRYLTINAAACRMVGKSAEEIVGKDDRALFPPQQAEMLMGIDRNIFATGKPITSEEELDTVDSRRIFLATKGPLRDEQNRIFGTFGISRDITRRQLAERALQESQDRLKLFIEHAPAALAMFDRDMRYIAVSQRWKTDYKLGDSDIIGRWHYEVFPDLPEEFKAIHRRGLAGEVVRSDEDRFERADGTVHWLRWEMRPWHSADGNVAGIVIFSEDITGRKQIESELRIAATAFESQLGMFIAADDENILRINRAFTDISGYEAADVLGKTPRMLGSERQDHAFYVDMWKTIASRKFWQGEMWINHRNGPATPVLMSVTAVLDDGGKESHYVGTFSDLSRHKQAEQVIHSLSFYDALTTLPNRRLMLERLKQVVHADKQSAGHGAVLFIDLDDFSNLNDTRGHEVGDQALIEVANRLQACVPGKDNVARPSSDEFVVMIDNLAADPEQAAFQAGEMAERVREAIRKPMEVGGAAYECTASVGISLFRKGQTTADELMRQTDASMYQVKRLGRDRVHFFDAKMQSALEERVALETALRKAIPGQLLLHYQPQVDDKGGIFGAEVLVRWLHPEKGLINPGEFIPLAEDTGLILPLGHWVLETACRQLTLWETRHATRDLRLAVNVSALQFHQDNFVDQVLSVIDATGVDPTRLKLELTESMLVGDADSVVRKMGQLKVRGIRFSLDDFGTGFSSLSYLRRLPIDQLKIDQSFVRDIETDPNDAAIVRTIIALGQSLGLNVIAEGVETEGQRNFLAVHGCKQYQGYLFGRPVPIADFEKTIGA
jgi:diguanylate cyclase (GGDEF)-like protein/PAS domain S-box-containing protein